MRAGLAGITKSTYAPWPTAYDGFFPKGTLLTAPAKRAAHAEPVAESKPLTPERAAEICDHMNEDHAGAIATYARVNGQLPNVESARMHSLDERGMNLDVSTATGSESIRIDFDHVLNDVDDARDTLIAMAMAHS